MLCCLVSELTVSWLGPTRPGDWSLIRGRGLQTGGGGVQLKFYPYRKVKGVGGGVKGLTILKVKYLFIVIGNPQGIP